MAMVDVTVRGAGIFGLSVAWACQRRGARVRVIDPNGPGAGSSGGIVGALAPHVPENWNDKKAFQLRSLLAAPAWWAEVAEAAGRDPGYRRSGRLQPLDSAEARFVAEARGAGAEDLWQGQARWSVTEAPEVPEDWRPLSPPGLWVFDTLSAQLHPRRAVEALAGALVARGAVIEADGPDEGAVVWATGWEGLKELSQTLGAPIGVGIKGQAVLLRCDAGGLPQLFTDGLHVIPHTDGTVAVGSTTEREFAHPTLCDDAAEDLTHRVRRLVPRLVAAPVLETWAGVRPRARSRAPVCDLWPGRPGHFIANGGFKIGFGMAPEVGEVMADLILSGVDRIPEGFRLAASVPG